MACCLVAASKNHISEAVPTSLGDAVILFGFGCQVYKHYRKESHLSQVGAKAFNDMMFEQRVLTAAGKRPKMLDAVAFGKWLKERAASYEQTRHDDRDHAGEGDQDGGEVGAACANQTGADAGAGTIARLVRDCAHSLTDNLEEGTNKNKPEGSESEKQAQLFEYVRLHVLRLHRGVLGGVLQLHGGVLCRVCSLCHAV